jgi:hexosaminidase
MKKSSFALICCFIAFLSYSQPGKNGLAIIPEPVKIITKKGRFLLPKRVVIEASTSAGIKPVTDYLKNKLTTSTGAKVIVKNTFAMPAAIKLLLYAKPDTALGKEGYHLWVTKIGIIIRANEPVGLFYGVQTLVQLFPKEIESTEVVRHISWTAPCVDIKDYPRFSWRGLMLDVSRHFFTKDEVKQYIDQMVRYKFNILHMHLTDDEGWRIEIKSLPRLTTVGAYNVKKIGEFGSFSAPAPDEPRTYGGFYTQDDIRDLVQYAKERFVNIMPEVDVPGHSMAAVVSYPELSCTPGADKFVTRSGERMHSDNTLNPSSEKTYEFLDKVLTEVAQLFPFDYVHMGGDECNKEFWAKSDSVTALMKRENLKTYQEVQSYFEKRLEKIVESKGKKFMGWDEIIEGGLGPNAAVMSWRGIKGGITAAKLGHQVVMSPTTFAYLDYMQSDRVNEPHVYETLRLNTTYEFDPVPDSVNAKLILGGQGNLWTEQVFNIRQVEYMTWPRGMAIAESVWSPKEKKDWDSFYPRVEKQFGRLDEAEIKYAPSMYDPSFDATMTPDSLVRIELTNEIPDLDIYYSFDNSFPDRFYPKYTEPLIAPKDATQLRVLTYRGKQPIGRMVTMPIAELRQRIEEIRRRAERRAKRSQ